MKLFCKDCAYEFNINYLTDDSQYCNCLNFIKIFVYDDYLAVRTMQNNNIVESLLSFNYIYDTQ